MSWISLCLGTGMISVSFQDKGSQPSQKEIFMISMMGGGGVNRSSFSFKSHPGILFGPCALAGLTEHNFLRTDNSFTVLLEDTETSPLNGLWVSGSKSSIGGTKAVLMWFARSSADRPQAPSK